MPRLLLLHGFMSKIHSLDLASKFCNAHKLLPIQGSVPILYPEGFMSKIHSLDLASKFCNAHKLWPIQGSVPILYPEGDDY